MRQFPSFCKIHLLFLKFLTFCLARPSCSVSGDEWVVGCVLSSKNHVNGGKHFPTFFRVNFYLYISTSAGNSSGEAVIVSVLDSDSCQALIVKFLLWQALWFTRAFCCFSRSAKPPFLFLVFGDHISLPWYLDCGWMREARVLQENWWVFGDTDRPQDCCCLGSLHWQFIPETHP